MLLIKNTLLGFSLIALLFQGATNYKVVGRYPIGGVGGFDYVMLDVASRRLYVSHASQVKHGFTSNGRENKVSMFDPETLKLIKKIDVGKGPDGIYYEPKTKRVFTNNHGSHDVTAIDAATGDVVGTVQVKGDGEQAIIGKDGLIYLNSEDTAEVVVFDPKTKKIFLPAAEYTETPPAQPGGRPTRTMKPGSFAVLVVSKS